MILAFLRFIGSVAISVSVAFIFWQAFQKSGIAWMSEPIGRSLVAFLAICAALAVLIDEKA